MEIRVLRYFLAVAREGNIAGAAAFLHLTQPTLSRQIRDLEEELGQTLLVRKSHGVALTAEGVLFRKRAEEILSMVDKTEAEFASMGEVVSGDIYIGGGETQAVRLIADIAREVRARHPGVRYHLFSGNAEDVTERLDKGLIDFGILIQPADISKYDYLNLPVKDRWGVVMRKDSPLARVEAVRRGDLLGVPLICSRQALLQGRTGNKYGEWFGDDFEKMDVAATFNLVYNACRMVEAGILPEAEYVWHNRTAFRTAAQAIGYKEFFPYFEGTQTLEQCTDKLKQASRNYAKRQLTWFRRQTDAVWLEIEHPDTLRRAGELVRNFLAGEH